MCFNLTAESYTENFPLIRQSTETFHPSFVEQADGSIVHSQGILNHHIAAFL